MSLILMFSSEQILCASSAVNIDLTGSEPPTSLLYRTIVKKMVSCGTLQFHAWHKVSRKINIHTSPQQRYCKQYFNNCNVQKRTKQTFTWNMSESESESELLYDWRLTANQFVLATSLLRLTTSIFFQLIPCGYSPYVISSLTTGWVGRLQLLLGLASAVILRSESRGTHDHISVSQTRDSPNLEVQVPAFILPQEQGGPDIPPGTGFYFNRLLGLARLQWRYSTPPPHGCTWNMI
jgi:hypothetical protein